MRVLLLEDEHDIAESLATGLTLIDENYVVSCVGRLSEAENLIRDEPFDVALVDLTLPDASACEAPVTLRRAAPDVAVVALTGRDFESVALELAHHGVQDYLQKGTTSISRVHEALQLAAVRHRREAELRRQACRDPLTGAINRAELKTQLNKALSHADRTGYAGALMLLDIDDFKAINDTHGHRCGDAVLKSLVGRLMSVTRQGDSIARVGGDEFVVILEGLANRTHAAAAADKILAATNYEMPLNDRAVRISTSIGIAVFPDQAQSFESLLELADKAMYSAKSKGKGTYACYTPPEPVLD